MVNSVVVVLALLSVTALASESPAYEASNTVAYQTPYPANKWAGEHAYVQQTGYEGYAVPEEDTTLLDTFVHGGILSALAPVAKLGLKIAAKIGLVAVGLVSLFVVGSAFTAIVCAFTPLCTLHFNGLHSFDGESVRSMMTQDKLNQATEFLVSAIHKYKNFQKKLKSA